ncbi:ATP-dependent zinc metalloprotease FtsH [bioreactor metagenome]|uniref:ATP-dependent zinc metalloprotease FtsH n=1 Tax=bioreactor metagenome TaxID=1076179 RepID=A0A644WZZ6_9ZZZZ
MKDKPQGPSSPSPKKKFNFYWIYAIMAIAFFAMYFYGSEPQQPKEIMWQRFENDMLAKHHVEKIVVVNKEYAEIFIKKDVIASDSSYKDAAKGKDNAGPHYELKFLSPESFQAQLAAAEDRIFSKDTVGKTPSQIADLEKTRYVNVVPEDRTNWGSTILVNWILPIAVILGIWFLFMRMMNRGSGGGQIFNVGKSKAQLFDKDTQVSITFKDVAGLDEAKVEVVEVVDFLKNPKKYTSLGGKIPKGVLLVGPPGTGKTLLAKAVAGEAKVPFFSISGSDFVEMFVGVGASRVRDLFRQAKEKAPCIVFIDEIDAIGRARGRANITGANDERENTLNQLLTEMDGFSTNAGVIILAATNRADILDKALMRAGRFDRLIYVELPDLHEREDIFKVHIKPLRLSEDVKPDFLAKQTPGFSGADIANVCNEAALIAARNGKKAIEKQDFLDAIDRIIAGLEKRNKIISVDEKRAIAYHEAGHASVSWLLEHAHPLVKVTIIPRGKALGAAWYLPEERSLTTWNQIYDEMTSLLGGRASEDVNFNEVSTGALNDLERVTKQAYASVAYFGLSKKLGNISFFDSSGSQEFYFTKPYSEKTAEIIDSEVHTIVENAYQRAKDLLIANKEKVSQLAKILLEKEVIFREDVENIFGPRPWPDRDPSKHEEMKSDSEGPKNEKPIE